MPRRPGIREWYGKAKVCAQCRTQAKARRATAIAWRCANCGVSGCRHLVPVQLPLPGAKEEPRRCWECRRKAGEFEVRA